MSYQYEAERPKLFTDAGQRAFLRVRDEAARLLEIAGAVRLHKLMLGTGDSWEMLARVERLVELGELREVTGPGTPNQSRVFVSGKS